MNFFSQDQGQATVYKNKRNGKAEMSCFKTQMSFEDTSNMQTVGSKKNIYQVKGAL